VEVAAAVGAGDGEGKGALTGVSVAGAHAVRMASKRKKGGNFFISRTKILSQT
jgi:hypothetical protein